MNPLDLVNRCADTTTWLPDTFWISQVNETTKGIVMVCEEFTDLDLLAVVTLDEKTHKMAEQKEKDLRTLYQTGPTYLVLHCRHNNTVKGFGQIANLPERFLPEANAWLTDYLNPD